MQNLASRFTTHILVSTIIKFGYFSRGMLYLLIGVFALFFSIGLENKALDQKEIFFFIFHLPFGRELSLVFLIGLFGYSLWGFIRAISDFIYVRSKDLSWIQRVSYIFSGVFYGSLVYFLILLINNKEDSSSPSFKSFSEDLLTVPMGQFLLISSGIIGTIAGLLQIKKAFSANSSKELQYHKDKLKADFLFILISRIGIAIRGFIWSIIGFFGITAGLFTDISKIKETKDIFTSLVNVPFGGVMIAMLAIGFMCFGLYSISLSFWIDLPEK